ncbi:long-chain fatty acid--CoA ligase [Brevirhabdus pacifica]|uniref:3-methylmercaptopropionyl-CoA ligase n=1 Tax=Brevirhabdus pacifica TaxID=1267768 RepID=A0A1U7DLI2_9RHOB|nr:long-chain-fatty-acid--CoA ligase [Brevirhabdus pacifica]APX90775.1 long-chain fatty acid--CoA ligase [Brevirhabdus pacifica]OWU79561.1 long-chain fatty acid--CoA ligase [Loktanella sp. 22II-4b]PJJ87346.1 fatty-acyl-CoA synthase [Brevirhabdus pacifica]
MDGLMMNRPLRIADILTYAAQNHGRAEVVSVRCEGDVHRQTYAETERRVAQLAHGLREQGIMPGDRVATLAWNGYRHLELYYAISGIGAVCHTINPRLSAEQMLYILGHAQDRLLFVDLTFVPLIAKLAPQLPDDLRICVMTDRAHMPEAPIFSHHEDPTEAGDPPLCYEELLTGQPDTIDWPEFPEETAAGLCYTSGTTGNPKGALYSHRSTVLHALSISLALPDVLRPGRRIMPVVPLFHVNAWGLPYSAPLAGASLVFPGPALDGESLFDLMDREKVYSAWGVPTVWMGLLARIQEMGRIPEGFGDVVVGGSAAPASMIAAFEDAGVNVCHAWGMTEMSPVGTQGNLPDHMQTLDRDARIEVKSQQGRRLFGVEMKILDEEGHRLPHDGEASGALHVRGNTVVSAYFDNEAASEGAFDAEGWFATGDMARIDPDGFLTITDRAKDMIKSGGEWISSLDLENAIMGHPQVANCAVIAVPHPKWDERPLLVVVPTDPATPPTPGDLLARLNGKFASWQLPDDVVFVEELPLTATGKVSKLHLRRRFADYELPGKSGAQA